MRDSYIDFLQINVKSIGINDQLSLNNPIPGISKKSWITLSVSVLNVQSYRNKDDNIFDIILEKDLGVLMRQIYPIWHHKDIRLSSSIFQRWGHCKPDTGSSYE